jgi:virginiamycin B lyase
MLRQGGALVKFDYAKYSESGSPQDNSTALQFSNAFNLPGDLGTPIGLSVDQNDNVWIADTSSSSFFKFDPVMEKFTKYVTPQPRAEVYGNATGMIKTPVTGPYWTQIDGDKLVFNEQIGNAISVFDIKKESFVEGLTAKGWLNAAFRRHLHLGTQATKFGLQNGWKTTSALSTSQNSFQLSLGWNKQA